MPSAAFAAATGAVVQAWRQGDPPRLVVQRLDMTTDLLKRAVESFSNGVDPRIPALSTCYGLFNLNRLMAEKFARELEGLKTPRG